jgi:hypothetical protein
MLMSPHLEGDSSYTKLLYYTVHYCATLYCTVLYCSGLARVHCTIQHDTAQPHTSSTDASDLRARLARSEIAALLCSESAQCRADKCTPRTVLARNDILFNCKGRNEREFVQLAS